MNKDEVLKYVRAEAKKLGCVLRLQAWKINGAPSYKFVDRKNGKAYMTNMTLCSAMGNIDSDSLEDLVKTEWNLV